MRYHEFRERQLFNLLHVWIKMGDYCMDLYDTGMWVLLFLCNNILSRMFFVDCLGGSAFCR